MAMNKEIKQYFDEVISRSWTWERLTEEEKGTFLNEDFSRLIGTVKRRIDLFCLMYSCFLDGCGYKPIGWREPEEVPMF